jgi:hypothetical protein
MHGGVDWFAKEPKSLFIKKSGEITTSLHWFPPYFFHIIDGTSRVSIFWSIKTKKKHKIFLRPIWYGLMKKCSLLVYLKVHKYSFRIQLIIYFVRTFLWYDILLIPSPQHRPHELLDHSIVNIERQWEMQSISFDLKSSWLLRFLEIHKMILCIR